MNWYWFGWMTIQQTENKKVVHGYNSETNFCQKGKLWNYKQ